MITFIIYLVCGFICLFPNFVNVSIAATSLNQESQPIYQVLKDNNLLDSYMNDLVAEVAGNLTRAAVEWPGCQINRPYQPGLVNIYLIDSHKLPQKGTVNHNRNLRRDRMEGNAFTEENNKIIFIDTNMLKEFLAYTMLLYYEKMKGLNSLAAIKVNGLDSLQKLWNPSLNTKLRSREINDLWLMAYRGALAFIIGHEMGHIHIGKLGLVEEEVGINVTGKDRDLYWACFDLLPLKYRELQEIETQADNFAVSLIGRILKPNQPRLWYELGAHTYLSYNVNKQILNALSSTKSQYIRNVLLIKLGPELYSKLLNQSSSSGKGSIHEFFPKEHPVTLRRAALSLGSLAQSQYSYFYGEPFPVDIGLLEQITIGACQELKQKYGIQGNE